MKIRKRAAACVYIPLDRHDKEEMYEDILARGPDGVFIYRPEEQGCRAKVEDFREFLHDSLGADGFIVSSLPLTTEQLTDFFMADPAFKTWAAEKAEEASAEIEA
jgi:hypothetical protein